MFSQQIGFSGSFPNKKKIEKIKKYVAAAGQHFLYIKKTFGNPLFYIPKYVNFVFFKGLFK